MTNGLSVKNQDDFQKLYNDDPALAMSLLFQNISDLKSQCSLRLETCKNQQSSDKMKNMMVQAGGGIVGGIAAAWVYVKAILDK